MPMIEPMFASATDSMTPSSRHLTDSSASTNEHALLRGPRTGRRRFRDRAKASCRPGQSPVRLPSVVVVEARAGELAAATELVEHPVDDLLRRDAAVHGAALGLDRGLGRRADLAHQVEVQLVAQLQHGRRVAGLRGGLLDRCGGHALGEHRDALVDERADHAAGEEAAAVVDDDRRLLDLLATSSARASVSSLVCSPLMISTSGILSTGEKKCSPMKSAGRETPSASPVIGSVEVFEPSSASGGQMRLDLGEDLRLDGRVLEHRLDHEVAPGGQRRVVGRR